tara:strand:- start:3138 stop:3302 length:165 start_codon:yes stop_codon:yes gene_type:complete
MLRRNYEKKNKKENKNGCPWNRIGFTLLRSNLWLFAVVRVQAFGWPRAEKKLVN